MSETNKRGASSYQYPFPAIPKEWKRDEMQFAFGLRHLFDILFSKKVSSVLIGDGAVVSRNIAKKAVGLSHVADEFGAELDISGNSSVTGLNASVNAAQSRADSAYTAAGNAQSAADNAASAASQAQQTANTAVTNAAAAQSAADNAASAVSNLEDTVQDLQSAVTNAQYTASSAANAANSAQNMIQRLPDTLYPVGIIIIANDVPFDFGVWSEVNIGLTGTKAWERID